MSADSDLARFVPEGLQGSVATVRDIVVLAQERNLASLAAGIAYYAFVSLIPLLLLAVAVASFLGGEVLADRVVALVNEQLSSLGQERVSELLTNTAGRGVASVVGLVTLTWSALGLFRGLDRAFDEVYADTVDSSFLDQVRDALVVTLLTGGALAVVLGAGTVLALAGLTPLVTGALGTVALLVVVSVAFLPTYYVLPPVEVSVREVLPGVVIAAGGWVALQAGFRLYATTASRYAAYGIIGSVLLFVTSLYFAAVVVLVGAALNAVRRRDGPVRS